MKHIAWSSRICGLAQELLFTAVNMNTIQTITSSMPQQDARPVQNAAARSLAQQDARPVRNAAKRSQAEQGAANDTSPVRQDSRPVQRSSGMSPQGQDAASSAPEQSFNLLLGQLLGNTAQSASNQLPQQGVVGNGTADAGPLPDAQALAAAKQAPLPASASLASLLGGQGMGAIEQAQGTGADTKFADLLAGAGNDKGNSNKPVTAEAENQDHAAAPDQRVDGTKKPFSFPIQPEGAGQVKPETMDPLSALKTPEQLSLPEKNTPVQAANDLAAAQHGASAVQAQTVHSVVSAAPLPADGNLHVRPAIADLAEKFENTLTITRDGSRLAVKLEPEGLGKLDINLSLDQGRVHAQINVQDSATKTLIENNMQQIVDALLKDGMSVGGFSVSLQQGKGWDQAADHQEGAGREKADAPVTAVHGRGSRGSHSIVSIFV